MSNLRGAPLFLRPSVVRALTRDVATIAKGIAVVDVLPIKLAGHCPAPAKSEITRLDSSHGAAVNDLAEPAPAPAAPLPEHADPDLDRPEPEPESANARNAEIVAAWQAGDLVQDIAARFGLSRWTIYDIAKRAGLPKRPRGYAAKPETAARNIEVAKAVSEGASIDVLAERFGLTKTNIYKIANDAGIDRMAITRKAQAERRAAVLAAITDGEAIAEIATRVGMSKGQIYNIAAASGVQIPRKPRAEKPARKVKPVSHRAPVKESGLDAQAARESASQTQLAMPDPLRNTAGSEHSPTPSGPGFYSDAAAKRRVQLAGIRKAKEDRTAIETRRVQRRAEKAAADAAALDEFQAALAKVKARRESGTEIITPKPAAVPVSGAKLAEAIRKRDSVKAAPRQDQAGRALIPAPGREECPRCGIPGWKGCAHFLPCEDQPRLPPEERYTTERRQQQFTGNRQGIGASRL